MSRWVTPFSYVFDAARQVLRLTAPHGFYDAWTGETVIVPAGFESDGTTRPRHPRFARWIVERLIGHAFTPAYLRASVLHDGEIAAQTASWYRAHTRYFRALRAPTEAPRVQPWRAAVMTTVLLVAGPRW